MEAPNAGCEFDGETRGRGRVLAAPRGGRDLRRRQRRGRRRGLRCDCVRAAARHRHVAASPRLRFRGITTSPSLRARTQVRGKRRARVRRRERGPPRVPRSDGVRGRRRGARIRAAAVFGGARRATFSAFNGRPLRPLPRVVTTRRAGALFRCRGRRRRRRAGADDTDVRRGRVPPPRGPRVLVWQFLNVDATAGTRSLQS